jgi:hypothetical protein
VTAIWAPDILASLSTTISKFVDTFQVWIKSEENRDQYLKTYIYFCVHLESTSLNTYWNEKILGRKFHRKLK